MNDSKVAELPIKDGIDFNLILLDLNGDPLKSRDSDGESVDAKLGDMCVQALMANLQDDKADGVQKIKRFNLARKIQGSSESEIFPTMRLNSKHKKMIEELAEKCWPTLLYARIYEALEGTTEEDDE